MTETKTTGTPENSAAEEIQPDPQTQYAYTFSQWLWSEKRRIGTYTGLISAAFLIWNLVQPLIPNFQEIAKLNLAALETPLLIVHFLFILLVLGSFLIDGYVRYDEKYDSEQRERSIWQNLEMLDKEEAKEAGIGPKKTQKTWLKFKVKINKSVDQFQLAWFFCWVGWLALYFVLIGIGTAKLQNSAWLITSFNNFSSLMILVMFITLNFKTIGRRFILVLTIFGVILISILAALQTNFTGSLSSFLFLLLSGFVGSICMALFFGSLNSFFMRTSVGVIICLYFYAALQILFIFETDVMLKFLTDIDYDKIPSAAPELKTALEKNISEKINNVMICAYTMALLLKALLFLVVRWLMQTARLTFSMTQRKSFYNINEDDELLKRFVENTRLKKVSVNNK